MLVVVGRIGRAHGVHGQVAVDVRTDEPDRRLAPGTALVTDPEQVGPLTVRTGQVHSGRLLLTFDGVDDRTAAEALRGTFLLADVDPGERPGDDDEWYDHQLVGLEAVLADGTVVGRVSAVLHLPGHDVLAVQAPDDRELLVPFVAEIVPVVDTAAGRLQVVPPPGLIDDAEGETT
jgi:16S rRNA processing protein RimM